MANNKEKQTIINKLDRTNHVLVLEDINCRRTIVLDKANYSIGRDRSNSIVVSSKKVSRFHATLLRRNDTKNQTFSYWILDGDLQGNKSTNGIFVNKQRCLVQELKHQDLIEFSFEVKAYYYILSNPRDLMLLQSEDFDDQKINVHTQEFSKFGTGQQTIIISEPSLEERIETPELSKLASFPELSPHPIVEVDWQGNITYLNPAANHKFKNLRELSSNHPLLLGLVKSTESYGNNNNLFVREIQIGKHVFEQYIHYLSAQRLIRTYIFDFTKRKQLEIELKEKEERYKAFINNNEDGILLVDADNNQVLEANDVFSESLGYTVDEICHLTLDQILNLDSLFLQQEINSWLAKKNKTINNVDFCCKDKSVITLTTAVTVIKYKSQNILCFSLGPEKILDSEDITWSEKFLHDSLTGLANRNLFREQLTTAIANNQRKQEILSVILIEVAKISSFKDGFDADLESNLIADFAKRLRACLRAGDTVARWQSNQFMILLPNLKSTKNIGSISKRILNSVQQPFFMEQQKIFLKISMGISIYGSDGNTEEILLENAKIALTKSTQKRTNNYHFYNEKVQKEVNRLLRLEKLLVHALDRDEFLLYYQPQVNFQTKEITGLETLLRWQHPELGRIGPEQFIYLAQETGLIIPIGEWVLEQTCRQQKMWLKNGLNSLPITINISSEQFQQPSLVSLIRNIVAEKELNPSFLEIEITEDSILEDLQLAKETIARLNEIGVRICLDNFGSGTSSIGFLKSFKFDSLKISQSVINNVENNPQDLVMISSLINLGHTFGLRVIAQGIETKKQLELLANLGCQEIQGNLFCEPLTKEDVSNFLANPVYNF